MKNSAIKIIAAASLFTAIPTSCEGLYEKKAIDNGFISIHFTKDAAFLSGTKSEISDLDTNTFLLSVTDADGGSIFKGYYGSAPQAIEVKPGSYTIEACSKEFSSPLFDSPQYGDSKTVTVSEGGFVSVTLECVQMNCGLRIRTDKSFSDRFPGGRLCASNADGILMYGYSENRTGYFNPGSVKVTLAHDGQEQTLFSRNLGARQVLCLNITASDESDPTQSKGGIHIKLDTTRTWTTDNYDYGGSNPGDDISTALSVSQAKSLIGSNGVWVYGFIVGGDLSSSKCSFAPPFTSRTNIVIAEKSSCTNKKDCLSVQLAQGDFRNELNLVDNANLLGKQVFLKGNIVSSYFGIPGIQTLTDYKFRTP